MTTSPQGTERPPLTDEELAQYAELIDLHRQYGPALSIEGEARLLVEVMRLRTENTALAAKVARLNDRSNNDLAQMSRLIEERYTAKQETEVVAVKLGRVRAVGLMDPAADVPEFSAAYVQGWNDALAYVAGALGEDGGTER